MLREKFSSLGQLSCVNFPVYLQINRKFYRMNPDGTLESTSLKNCDENEMHAGGTRVTFESVPSAQSNQLDCTSNGFCCLKQLYTETGCFLNTRAYFMAEFHQESWNY